MSKTLEEIIRAAKGAKLSPQERNTANELMDWLLESDSHLDLICFYVVWAHEEIKWEFGGDYVNTLNHN